MAQGHMKGAPNSFVWQWQTHFFFTCWLSTSGCNKTQNNTYKVMHLQGKINKNQTFSLYFYASLRLSRTLIDRNCFVTNFFAPVYSVEINDCFLQNPFSLHFLLGLKYLITKLEFASQSNLTKFAIFVIVTS